MNSSSVLSYTVLRTIMILCLLCSLCAARATTSNESNAFALGFRFTELHENYRLVVKKAKPSAKEGLRKSLQKKMSERVQPFARHLALKLDLATFALNDLQGARSLADYNASLRRLRRLMPDDRSRASYDLGRTYALMLEALEQADKVSEIPFFGVVRVRTINGVKQPERTQGRYYELGHVINLCLQELSFTESRLEMETTDLARAKREIMGLRPVLNGHFGTAIESPL